MQPKVLLAKCITLLYRESLVDSKARLNVGLVRTAIGFIKDSNVPIDLNGDEKIIQGLKALVLRMCDERESGYELEELTQEVSIICKNDKQISGMILKPLQADLSENKLKRSVAELSNRIEEFFKEEKSKQILVEAANRARFKRDGITDWRNFIRESVAALEPFGASSNGKDPAVVSEYLLNDKEQLKDAFKKVDDFTSSAALLKFGQQGLNDMFAGGIGRGLTGCLYALSHHGKSDNLTQFFVDMMMLNEPFMVNPELKPMMIFISFENESEKNIDFMYKIIRERETGVPIEELPHMGQDERAAYVSEKLSVMGYTPYITRIVEGSWGYIDICNLITKMESLGYEVHALFIDYIKLASKAGCSTDMKGEENKMVIRKLSAFTAPKMITVFHAWQLNKEAKRELALHPPGEGVKYLAGAGFTEGCNTLETEMGFDIYLALVKYKGEYYNTYARGKHRVNNPAPIEKQQCCYKSGKVGRLPVDIYGKSLALKRPGEKPIAEGHSSDDDYYD